MVYTSFSGSHQDAIKKALNARNDDDIWDIPYLPIDPKDLGRSYQAVIRVNSQSGKGGITYLLESHYGIALPRRAQIALSQAVQRQADASGDEMMAEDIWKVFEANFLAADDASNSDAVSVIESDKAGVRVEAEWSPSFPSNQERRKTQGFGSTLAQACADALNTGVESDIQIVDVHTQTLNSGKAFACVEMRTAGEASIFGTAIQTDITYAVWHATRYAITKASAAKTESPESEQAEECRQVA